MMSETNEPNIQEYQQSAAYAAKGFFREGLNCAECVFKAYLDLGLTPEFPSEIIALASGFGGGIGKTRNTCGAFLGSALAVASKKGRKNPLALPTLEERVSELNDPEGVYQNFTRLVKEFEAEYGTILCRELTTGFEEFNSKERKKHCQQITGFAAGLAVKYALTDENKS